MKSKILIILVAAVWAANLFPEEPNGSKKFQLLPFVNLEKRAFSTIKLETQQDDFSNDIYTVDHLSLGIILRKSILFSTLRAVLPWHDKEFQPFNYDLNFGFIYHNYSAYLGKILRLKSDENEMLETRYYGISSKHEYKRSIMFCNLQYMKGKYPRLFYGTKPFNSLAINLQFVYPFRKIYPYGLLSFSKWSFNDDPQYQLSFGISLFSPPGINNILAPAIKHCPDFVQADKPNIYLYPEQECNVSVKINPNGRITKSIPEYNEGWNVTIKPNGIIDDEYSFLFYEADVTVETPETGWCVNTHQLSNFFDTLLHEYGLNDNEIEDFKEYWTQRLTGSRYYSIFPLINEEVDDVCPISIQPEPDHILRLWFVFIPQKKMENLKTPIIPKFSRNGFEVVEWGGISGD
jgi:hypothetical protein